MQIVTSAHRYRRGVQRQAPVFSHGPPAGPRVDGTGELEGATGGLFPPSHGNVSLPVQSSPRCGRAARRLGQSADTLGFRVYGLLPGMQGEQTLAGGCLRPMAAPLVFDYFSCVPQFTFGPDSLSFPYPARNDALHLDALPRAVTGTFDTH